MLIVYIFEKRNISIEGRIVKYRFYSQLLSLIAVTGNFCIKMNTWRHVIPTMIATSYDFLSKISVASYQVTCISVNSSKWNNVTTCTLFIRKIMFNSKFWKKCVEKIWQEKYSQLLTVFSLWSVWCSFQQPTAVLFTRPKKRMPFFDTALAVVWVLKTSWTLKLIKHVELSKNMQDIEYIWSIDSKNWIYKYFIYKNWNLYIKL